MNTKILDYTLNKTAESKPSIFAKLVAKHFKKMRHGLLTIEDIQSGQSFHFGDGHGIKAHILVKNPVFFRKLVLATDIGLGESYVAGDWETEDLGKVIRWFILNLQDMPSMSGGQSVRNLLVNAMAAVNKIRHAVNSNSIRGSKKNISNHYDLGNEFFASFLDPTMTYSSALFTQGETENLQAAQLQKFKNLAEFAGLTAQHKVLEIGTGWGEFSCYLAEKYGCQITSLTISDQQFAYAQNKISERNLSHLITVKNQDYRDFHGQYDRIFTVEMIEAVGHAYLPTFFAKCDSWLKPGGKMVHQVILSPDSRYESFKTGVDWIQKHIFPGSLLPSLSALLGAANQNGLEFMLSDFKDMGLDYAKTLRAWHVNFENNFALIKNQNFDEAFRRKWNYYLAYCEAAFAMRNITVAQIGLTRPNTCEVD